MTPDHPHGISSEDDAILRDKARRMTGLGVLHQIQVLARRYQEEQAFKRRAARTLAISLVIVAIVGALLFIAAPGLLTTLFRSFS